MLCHIPLYYRRKIKLGIFKGKAKLTCSSGNHPMLWWNSLKGQLLQPNSEHMLINQLANQDIHCILVGIHPIEGVRGEDPRLEG